MKLLLQKIKEICGVSARQARFADLERRLAAHSEALVAHNDEHEAHRNELRTIAALNATDEERLEMLADAVAETFEVIAIRRGYPLSKDFRDVWRRAQ